MLIGHYKKMLAQTSSIDRTDNNFPLKACNTGSNF